MPKKREPARIGDKPKEVFLPKTIKGKMASGSTMEEFTGHVDLLNEAELGALHRYLSIHQKRHIRAHEKKLAQHDNLLTAGSRGEVTDAQLRKASDALQEHDFFLAQLRLRLAHIQSLKRR